MRFLCLIDQTGAWTQPVLDVIQSQPLWSVIQHQQRWNAELHKSLPHKPHVYVVVFESIDTNGLGLIRKVLRFDRKAVVLALIPATKALTIASLQEGARGVCYRTEIDSDLVVCLDSVSAGRSHLSPKATQLAIDLCLKPESPQETAVTQMVRAALTPKELQVLHKLREGHAAKSVAHYMDISVYTVNQHLRSIYRKLNVHNRIEANRKPICCP